jgi:hypothetical protein
MRRESGNSLTSPEKARPPWSHKVLLNFPEHNIIDATKIIRRSMMPALKLLRTVSMTAGRYRYRESP